ncbi:DinB family protein [Paraburkholderia dilworthii]|uniref:DinB family protein n=1 Tax=Paraburkholderia dilworthii TaxID=948106 RepID=A0ABW9D331_9BURK
MNPDPIAMFAQYNQWANRLIYDAVAALPEGTATEKRATTFGSIERTLGHCCAVGLIFQAHLEGRPHGFTARNMAPQIAFEELSRSQQEVDAWCVALADETPADVLGEVVEFSFLDGGAGAMTRMEMLLHVINHNSYHRGFVVDSLKQMSVSPPVTDLPVFLRDAYRRRD